MYNFHLNFAMHIMKAIISIRFAIQHPLTQMHSLLYLIFIHFLFIFFHLQFNNRYVVKTQRFAQHIRKLHNIEKLNQTTRTHA